MGSVFDQRSAFMRSLTWITDVVWINLMIMIASVPVITIGAALSAGYDTLRRTRIGQGAVTRNFVHAFRANFVQATCLWAVLGPSGALIAASWILLRIVPLMVIQFALSIIWMITMVWVWPLQATFENSLSATLRNAFLIGLTSVRATCVMLMIDVLMAAIMVASWFYYPQGLFALALICIALPMALKLPVAERVLSRFRPAAQSLS